MKKVMTLFALIFLIQSANAQVPKKVLVEHFTNTVCSVCASQNPGFYTNFNNQKGVLHLAVHPSSPYASCLLNKHNVSENDARTNYYDVYGSTPRFVIQGVVIPSNANPSSATIFTPYLGKTSPVSIRIYQYKFGTDSIRSKVVIKTEASNTLSNLKLAVFLAEDTVVYTSPNGEKKHFNVFRKSLTGITGVSITLASTVGDSVVYIKSSPSNSAWKFPRIYTLAILQEGTSKAIVQSEAASPKANEVITNVDNQFVDNNNIQVLMEGDAISIQQNQGATASTFNLYDITGKHILTKTITENLQKIQVQGLSPGIYLYGIDAGGAIVKSGKLFITK